MIHGLLDVDRDLCARHAASSQQLVLALAPRLGYDRAAEVAKRAVKEHRTIEQQVVAEGVLPEGEARELLDPAKLA